MSRSPSTVPPAVRDGRIASVAGCVLGGERSGAAAQLATLLDGLFDQVLWVGAAPPPGAPGRRVPAAEGPASALADLVGALRATDCEGALVVSAELRAVTPALLLSLFAWPEAAAVVPRCADRTWPLCALYRRQAVLPLAEASLAEGALDLTQLLARLETSYLEEADLAAVAPGFAEASRYSRNAMASSSASRTSGSG